MIEITHQTVAKWLNDYSAAWKSYEPTAIGALFSENVAYRYSPFSEPLAGRDKVVASWLEHRDPPNSYIGEYQPIAVEGNTAVANGHSLYFEADGQTIKREFNNIFVIHFDEDGLCADFCEWYMEKK